MINNLLVCAALMMLLASGCSKETKKPSTLLRNPHPTLNTYNCLVKSENPKMEIFPGDQGVNIVTITGNSGIKMQKANLFVEFDKKVFQVDYNSEDYNLIPENRFTIELTIKALENAPNGSYTIKCFEKSKRGEVLGTCQINVSILTFKVSSTQGYEFSVLPPKQFVTSFQFTLSPTYNKPIKTTIISEVPKGLSMSLDHPVLKPNYFEKDSDEDMAKRSMDPYFERPHPDESNIIEATFDLKDEAKSGTYVLELLFESQDYKQTMKLTINVTDFYIVCLEDSKYFSQDKVTFNIEITPRKGFKGECVPFFVNLPKGITPVFSENPILIDNKMKSFDVTLMFDKGMQGIFTPVLTLKNENGNQSWMLIARKGNYEIQVYPPIETPYKTGNDVEWLIMFGSLSNNPLKLYCKVSAMPKGWAVKQSFDMDFLDEELKPVEIGKEKEITISGNDTATYRLVISIPKDADMKNTTVRFEIRDGDNIRIEDLSKDYVMPDHKL
jgi:hypothetical protein